MMNLQYLVSRQGSYAAWSLSLKPDGVVTSRRHSPGYDSSSRLDLGLDACAINRHLSLDATLVPQLRSLGPLGRRSCALLIGLALLFASALQPALAQTNSTPATAGTLFSGKPDYTLGAGDAIRIQVFQNPDLTIETRVSESGSISYPLIGSVELGGLSIERAEKKLSTALEKGGFLQRPQVNIALLQIRGNQVAVLGQVNRPGRFPLETANTRLSDMLAMAGGASSTGDDVAVVVGTRQGKLFRQQIDIPSIFLADKLQDNIVLQGGDSIYVHRAPVFYVYGQVQRPGAYRIERGMTIMQALALGGGPTARGSEKRLRLHRSIEGGGLNQITPKLTDQVVVNDVLYVDESIF